MGSVLRELSKRPLVGSKLLVFPVGGAPSPSDPRRGTRKGIAPKLLERTLTEAELEEFAGRGRLRISA